MSKVHCPGVKICEIDITTITRNNITSKLPNFKIAFSNTYLQIEKLVWSNKKFTPKFFKIASLKG